MNKLSGINKNPVKIRILIYLLPVAGLFSGIFFGSRLDFHHFENQAEIQHSFILKRAMRERQEETKIFDALDSKKADCSLDDIQEMKGYLSQSKYIADIGRMIDGRIRCTAMSGLVDGIVLSESASKQRNDGALVWQDVEFSQLNKEKGSVALRGSVAIFTHGDLYDDLAAEGTNSVVQINSRDQEIIYWYSRVLDNYRLKKEELISEYIWPQLQKTSCLSDICVQSEFRVSCRLNTLVLSALGLTIGLLLAITIGMRWRVKHGLRYRLVEAMRSRQIFMEYQPLLAVADKRVVGAEALARWRHDEVGSVSPDIFIPLIQKMGLRKEFTRYIVTSIIEELEVKLKSEKDFYVGINVFPADLEEDDFFLFLHSTLKRMNIPAGKIVLEVTEGSQFSVDDPARIFERYRSLGVKIYIDDFGVGYSNISRMLEGGIDGIKLDRVFIRSVDSQAETNSIFDNVVAMTQKIGVQIVIEGVETIEQHQYIARLAPGAIGQGWFYGRPGPAGALTVH
ncbi:EAL domain-containing protein [Comamonas sp. C24C]